MYSVCYAPGSFHGPEPYDGQAERVSFLATYPNPPMYCQDGWLSVFDWYDVGLQAMNSGVNDFVWFAPGLSESLETMRVIFAALVGIGGDYLGHYRFIYEQIACIADWDMDGTVEEEDLVKFETLWVTRSLETDFDNDGNPDVDEFGNPRPDEDDLLTFRVAFESGDCGGAVSMSVPAGCVADWNHDGGVGVPDIFAFLSGWFANVTAARCFGGACGVPAIFAFLQVWFATPMGPCSS